MKNFKKALKAGLDAALDHSEEYESRPKGARYRTRWKTIKCTQCDGERFEVSSKLLNTQGMTYLGLDWLNRTAIVAVCARCSAIHWFAESLEELQESTT